MRIMWVGLGGALLTYLTLGFVAVNLHGLLHSNYQEK